MSQIRPIFSREARRLPRLRRIGLTLVTALVFGACSNVAPTSPAPARTEAATSTPTLPGEPSASATVVPTDTAAPTPFVPIFQCGEPDPTCQSLSVKIEPGIAFTSPVGCGADNATCILKFDSLAPPTGTLRPVVVMIPGGPVAPGIRGYLWTLARLVAWRGAVVFTADYRSGPQWGGGYPQTFADVACAIAFARDHAAALGGDPRRVTLLAHSFGGFPGSVTSLSQHDFSADEPGCLATATDGRPDAFVGVGAIYGFDHIGQDFLAQMLGGTRDEVPDAWNATDISVLSTIQGHRTPPVRLLAGTADLVAPMSTADEFAAILRGGGINVTVTSEDGANHDSILTTQTTLDAVMAFIAPAGR